MLLTYCLTYLNQDNTPFHNFLKFKSNLELNDYIAGQERKFGRTPVDVVIVK